MLESLSDGLIVAVVDFLMVFLVLGGLAGVLVGLKKFVKLLEKPAHEAQPEPEPVSSEPASEQPEPDSQVNIHIAAITAAIHEFTGLPVGAFRIVNIDPVDHVLSSIPSDHAVPTDTHIAAIAATIHEFTAIPPASFRIVGIKHIGTVSAWKMAGRLDLMDMDVHAGDRLQ